ncbi:MAG: VCBS repeat-containing protein [Aquabacterium sp.]|nr:MAG: VCBS repeat-containing protein [Aquabacterium sp.]
MRLHALIALTAMSIGLAACGGGGSSASSEVVLTPIAVAATSYGNFKNVGLTPQALPVGMSGVGTVRAYADFSRDGRLDLFTATLTYDVKKPKEEATPSTFAFWVKQPDGSYRQSTTVLRAGSSAGCIHPRKAIVADFNADQRPDVFVACHGYDEQPFPGEKNKVILSQSDGTYITQNASEDIGFFHSATAADINGDQRPDVLVTNNFDAETSVITLINQGNGSFLRETRSGSLRFPTAVQGPKPYYSVELLDLDEDGDLDVLLGGHEWQGAPTLAFLNPGNFEFGAVTPLEIPAVTNKGVVLDFTVTGTGSARALWVLRTTDDSVSASDLYKGWTIQRVSGFGSTPLQSSVTSGSEQWFAWILPTKINGSPVIASDDASVPVKVPVAP